MSRIWSMMDVGKRSMMNSQTALQTVSHNVANKNTEGYSRQRVDLQTNEPVSYGKLRMGTGARANSVTRINNKFIEKQLETEGAVLSHKDARAGMLMRVEQVYNEQMNKGLNKYLGEFFNAYREFSNSPESLALRNLVKESGDNLAKDFQRVNRQMTKIQAEADFQIATEISAINELTKEIATLNDKIQMVEINAREANDERDRRELLIKQLAEKVNIHWGESSDGILTITAGNTAILVSGSQQRDLQVSATGARPGKREGNLEIFYKSSDYSTAANITQQITAGSVGGLLEVRDKFINENLAKVDELAQELTNEVNKAHMTGYDRYNNRGRELFQTDGLAGAAATIRVNEDVSNDPGLVVAAAQPGAPGDNRVANVISALQYQQKLEQGQSTFDDFYNNIVGKVGIATSRSNSEVEAQKDIVNQLKNIRESISGVSLDEETAKMIEYQKSFDASARLIRAADEMMDTVLNIKRM